MNVYLPIAEISVNLFVLLSMGMGVGLLTGIFGVGGGFLMTPLLIFIGVPSGVAVGSLSCQVLATSMASLAPHLRSNRVDFRMAYALTGGGVVGSFCGVLMLSLVRSFGQLDFVINLAYVVLLGGIGTLMFYESVLVVIRRRFGKRQGAAMHHKKHVFRSFPFRVRFVRSKIYVSIFAPLLIGGAVGFLAALLGVGGGVMLIPAMIYLLGMTTTVVGTSLANITLIAVVTAFFQAVVNQSVDINLSLVLIGGSLIGSYLGGRMGGGLRGEEMRSLLALIILSIALKIVYDLVAEPEELYHMVVI
jgi:hypothetical protein